MEERDWKLLANETARQQTRFGKINCAAMLTCSVMVLLVVMAIILLLTGVWG